MNRVALWFVALALVLPAFSACGNGGGSGAGYAPGGGGGVGPTPISPQSIGFSLPSGTLGVEDDPVWGTIGGYTQSRGSQVLAFPPGTKVTLRNLSATNDHTLDVIAISNGPPAAFPANPVLSFTAAGHGKLGAGFASGILRPGESVTVTLSTPGTYLIGCAFHYLLGMRDVIQVSASATPGPQASPGSGPNAARAPLVDQRGRGFTLAALRDEALAVTFVSAHCTDACPLVNAQFSNAARVLARRGIAARLLTVTLDPEHDTPAAMRAIAKTFDASERRWLIASGPAGGIHALMRAFGVVAIAGKNGYREAHSTYVYVLAPGGELADTLLASTNLSDDVVTALSTLSKEVTR